MPSKPYAPDGVTQDHEEAAWAAIRRATLDWRRREAPSLGARAFYVVGDMYATHAPSFIEKCRQALRLYLADWQMVEHGTKGFQRPTRMKGLA